MGTVILKIAPLNPSFVPTEVQARDAHKRLIRLVPDGYEHEILVYDKPEFIDSGEYLSTAACPMCGATINFDTEENFEMSRQWISDVCSQLAVTSSGSLVCSLPWCGHLVPIALLKFEPGSVFASCELRVVEPLIEDNQLAELLAALTEEFGVPVMHIWSRY